MSSNYQVQLPLFEGPLDLLLQLIERAELDITKVSLARVTDQYLEYLQRLPAVLLDDLAAFLVIAARLIQIKSEALLPQPPDRDPEEEDPGEALAQQLAIYKRFKEIAALLEDREAQGLRTYLRLSASPASEPQLDLEGLGPAALQAAMQELLASLQDQPAVETVVDLPRVRIRDKISQLLKGLSRRPRLNFKALLRGASSRLEIVVSFLAVLELIKSRRVRALQEAPFGEIVLVRGERWGADQVEEVELEFDE